MSLTRLLQPAITRLPGRSTSHIHLAYKRGFADKPQQPSPIRHDPDLNASPESVQNEFIHHTMFAFKNLGRIFAYVGYGTLIVGLVTATAFEGGHLWVERQMRTTPDEDAKRWGWEVEGWTGGERGGTSSSLGFFGRHAVRAAWFSLHNILPFGGAITIAQAHGAHGVGSLNVAPSDLESARLYLEEAMARVRDQDGKMRMDKVGSDLLERHAAVLERIGTRAALARAREDYLQIVSDSQDLDRFVHARLAVKIGDISERLGNVEAAFTWWTRGISLTSGSPYISAPTPARTTPSPPSTGDKFASVLWKWTQGTSSEEPPIPFIETQSSKYTLPIQPPSSAAAQRTLVTALLSISAHYSKRNQLKKAKLIQEYAISLINAMVLTLEVPSDAPEPQSPGQTLHHMYLLQRKSVLSLHHAEVTYSLSSAPILRAPSLTEPITDLLTAGSLSEVVAQVLTGTSSNFPDVPSKITPKPEQESGPKVPHPFASHSPLARVYRESPWLRTSAQSVLRDARRTAVEAWDLCGVLYGEIRGGEIKALESFERALSWAEEPGMEGKFFSGTAVDAWESLWERYMEARGRV